ncbi:hypothetical protein BO70DRAFT_392544 [Aspergillus heteromorphus CBS 117.55]|uniref:Woronin body major protein n=1 Tax=Aspergillus heteromorphus CBS 117.55 TaxID=1448321 RepID=A0A317WY24_9EURO|nr:uncharacterized protein BO70DRAFT_392544 [Aspergillus heteromorphus CBS 117.55]PWY90875.1 hypothetical protein BO70DRAFT_392544 [Aspergillus heteromorphus CBS 117.55]
MFRRKRSSSQHQVPLSHSSSQSAQSAASHAFLKSQPSSSSLSSAAAAAALRSLTPTPTSVENVQTKRMMQRRASVSSQQGGAPSLRPTSGNGLRRSSSSASMGTRTFRDQSPRRPASSSGPTDSAPPLPSIPRAYSARNTQAQRSSSIGPPMRSSPRAKPTPQRGTSVDRNPAHGSTPSPDLRRPASRNSVNFSYPMTSRPTSPSAPRSPSDRRDISITGHLSSADPPKTKNASPRAAKIAKAKVAPGSPARGVPSAGTAVAAAQAAIVPRSPDASSPSVSPRIALPRELIVPDQAPSQPVASADHRQLNRPNLIKRPSTVTEDAQGEQRAESNPLQKNNNAPRGGSVTPDVQPIVKLPPTPDTGKDQLLSPPISPPDSNKSVEVGRDGQSSMRQSGSPARSARFSRHLLVAAFAGEQLHQPPPRSLSPAKSAMKAPRKSSLSPEGRTESILRPGPPLSELSDAMSVASDDGLKQGARRKPTKVSFDDEAEVVGVAASPPTSPEEALPESPPSKPKSKSSWFSAKRKPSPLNTRVDEFDEVLKPRRALPSFGSIRADRQGDVQDKAPEQSDNESTTSSDSPAEALGWSFSNDHAIGGVIANTESDERQTHVAPLMLANAAESESEVEKSPQQDHFPARSAQQAASDDLAADEPRDTEARISKAPLEVPDIKVLPASPELKKERHSLEWYEVPGGFPRSSLEFDPKASKAKAKDQYVPANDMDVDAVDDGESDDESGASIYSDAEEDFDGNGFGSINAIVDGEGQASQTPSPTTPDSESNDKPSQKPDWPDFPETCQIGGRVNTVPHAMAPIPESPGSSNELLPFSSPYPPFPIQSTDKRPQNGDVSRSSSVPVKPARQSLLARANEGPSPGDRALPSVDGTGSMPGASVAGASQVQQQRAQDGARMRPVSWSPALGKEGQANGKSSPASSRPLSSGSDSSSSFKRASRPSRAQSNYTMRRTMRGSPPGRLAPRATSPQAEIRPISSESGGGSMRTTLRGNAPKREKASFFSTGKASKAKLTKTPAGQFTTRFPDSDSDDEGYEAWKSQHRYDDSSDDGERGPNSNTLRPVRGIPRRQGARDGDSTELEDSSDDDRSATPRAAPQSPGKSTPSRDPALAAIAKNRGMTDEEMDDFLRQSNRGRKPGLFHRFSIRKSKSPVNRRLSTKAHAEASARNGVIPEHDAARGDPPLPGAEANIVTTITATNAPPPTPSKLLRRPSQRSTRGDNSWPLRSEPNNESGAGGESSSVPPGGPLSTVNEACQNGSAAAVTVAPASAPVAKENENPQHAASGVKGEGPNASDVVITPSGRKKRFPRLRKAFGLRTNLDFDARVPIPFSVFPSSYRSDAVPEATLGPARVEEEVNLDRTSHVEREDTRTSAPLPDPRVYGKEEVDFRLLEQDRFAAAAGGRDPRVVQQDVTVSFDERVQTVPPPLATAAAPGPSFGHHQQGPSSFAPAAPQPRYPEVALARERYREPAARYPARPSPTYDQSLQNQLDITEREYRRRVNPTYDVTPSHDRRSQAPPPVNAYGPRQPVQDVSYDRTVQSEFDVSYDRAYQPKPVETSRRDSHGHQQLNVEPVRQPQPPLDQTNVKVLKSKTVIDSPPSRKMGYYDDDGNYHSFRRGVQRAADRVLHPSHHHGSRDHEEVAVADERGPVQFREGVRENVRIVEPRSGGGSSNAETVPIPVHFIRIGDILILQGRPCQVIRISVSPQTGQHRYLGVDLFTRELQEESSFISNPSPSVVVQTMLGPVYKTYRILDLRDDGLVVAMTETGDVKQGLPVVPQGHLFRRIREAFEDGRGSVRALVINDGGRELVVDYKVIHASRL